MRIRALTGRSLRNRHGNLLAAWRIGAIPTLFLASALGCSVDLDGVDAATVQIQCATDRDCPAGSTCLGQPSARCVRLDDPCVEEGPTGFVGVDDGVACPLAAGTGVCSEGRCIASRCGDGIEDGAGGEECDDGNIIEGDGCDTNCASTGCGNGIRTAGEPCDDGNAIEGDGCDTNCTPSGCGNGIPAGLEACDDGNLVTESCAYGLTACTVCAVDCQLIPGQTSYCGDGIVDGPAGEACDDGNPASNDGCDSACSVEATFVCEGEPSDCAVVVYVNRNATGSDTGQSWPDAFVSLRDALDAAEALGQRAQLWIAEGVYYPDDGRRATNDDTTESFRVPSSAALFGGFAGGETAKTQRDFIARTTVLSGDIDQNSIRDGLNSSVVVMADSPQLGGVLDGLTIRDGFNVLGGGAGLRVNSGASVIARNTIIEDNELQGGGAVEEAGGVQCSLGFIQIADSRIRDNRGYGPGGLYAETCDITLDRTILEDNVGTGGVGGGGLHAAQSAVIVRDCEFRRNTTDGTGGGAMLTQTDARFEGTTFDDNSALAGAAMSGFGSLLFLGNSDVVAHSGSSVLLLTGMVATVANTDLRDNDGGTDSPLSAADSTVTFSNSRVWGNAGAAAGFASVNTASTLWVDGSLVYGNTSGSGPSVILNVSSTVIVRSSTMVDNTGAAAIEVDNLMLGSNTELFVDNTILRNPGGPEIADSGFDIIEAHYSNIRGAWSWSGADIVDLDPVFTDIDGADNMAGTLDDDYSLAPTSPCIDAGDNARVPVGMLTDLRGWPRRNDVPSVADTGAGVAPIVDIGALERQ